MEQWDAQGAPCDPTEPTARIPIEAVDRSIDPHTRPLPSHHHATQEGEGGGGGEGLAILDGPEVIDVMMMYRWRAACVYVGTLSAGRPVTPSPLPARGRSIDQLAQPTQQSTLLTRVTPPPPTFTKSSGAGRVGALAAADAAGQGAPDGREL